MIAEYKDLNDRDTFTELVRINCGILNRSKDITVDLIYTPGVGFGDEPISYDQQIYINGESTRHLLYLLGAAIASRTTTGQDYVERMLRGITADGDDCGTTLEDIASRLRGLFDSAINHFHGFVFTEPRARTALLAALIELRMARHEVAELFNRCNKGITSIGVLNTTVVHAGEPYDLQITASIRTVERDLLDYGWIMSRNAVDDTHIFGFHRQLTSKDVKIDGVITELWKNGYRSWGREKPFSRMIYTVMGRILKVQSEDPEVNLAAYMIYHRLAYHAMFLAN